jgi:hypothetical protein
MISKVREPSAHEFDIAAGTAELMVRSFGGSFPSVMAVDIFIR